MNTLEAGENPRDIILKPAVTEKSPTLMGEGKCTFEVSLCANKTEIKIVIEVTLGIEVGQVTTQNRRGKAYWTRMGQGKRKDVKRMIVTLRKGAIDIFDGQA